jgi:hypothetical protein
MKKYNDDPSYPQESWDENAEYTDLDNGGGYGDYDDYDEDSCDDADDETGLDEEMGREHNFRIAMNVFDLISMLIGLAVILVLAAMLFSLVNWVQQDISQSLSVFTAPFQ